MSALAVFGQTAPEKMGRHQMAAILVDMRGAFPDRVSATGDEEARKILKDGAKVIMQLWNDLNDSSQVEAEKRLALA